MLLPSAESLGVLFMPLIFTLQRLSQNENRKIKFYHFFKDLDLSDYTYNLLAQNFIIFRKCWICFIVLQGISLETAFDQNF